MTKGDICRDCIRNGSNQPTCLNINCNNKLKRQDRKYCSRKCMMEHREFLRGDDINKKQIIIKETKYNFCQIHQIEYRGDSCIKCDLDKQEKKFKQKLKKGWKVCPDCNINIIQRSRYRCRCCVEKHFKKRKELENDRIKA